MGQTSADFGSVPTAGLVQRARNRLGQLITALEATPMNPDKKERIKNGFILAGVAMEAEYELVQKGASSEADFRTKLVHMLAPEISGGRRGPTIRW